ncbi:MAG: hypothetical protein ACXWVJ_09180 [Caulobacteraceae bacterium]
MAAGTTPPPTKSAHSAQGALPIGSPYPSLFSKAVAVAQVLEQDVIKLSHAEMRSLRGGEADAAIQCLQVLDRHGLQVLDRHAAARLAMTVLHGRRLERITRCSKIAAPRAGSR